MKKRIILILVAVAALEGGVGFGLYKWGQQLDAKRATLTQNEATLASEKDKLRTTEQRLDDELDDLRQSQLQHLVRVLDQQTAERLSVIWEREVEATEVRSAEGLAKQDRWIRQQLSQLKEARAAGGPQPESDTQRQRIAAVESLLERARGPAIEALTRARDISLLQGSGLAERFQAEIEYNQRVLGAAAEIAGLDIESLLPQNEYSYFSHDELQDLQRRWEDKRNAIRKLASDFRGLYDSQRMLEPVNQRLARIAAALEDSFGGQIDVSSRFVAAVKQSKSSKELLSKLTTQLAESQTARDAEIDRRERELLAVRLSRDGSDRAAFARFQELTEAEFSLLGKQWLETHDREGKKSNRQQRKKALIEYRRIAAAQVAFSQSPALDTAPATAKPEQLLSARMIDPVFATELDGELRFHWSIELENPPGSNQFTDEWTPDQQFTTMAKDFERWLASQLTDRELLRIKTLYEAQLDFLRRQSTGIAVLRPEFAADEAMVRRTLEHIADEIVLRESHSGPSHPLATNSTRETYDSGEQLSDRFFDTLQQMSDPPGGPGPHDPARRKARAQYDSIRLAKSRVPYLNLQELERKETYIILQACRWSLADLERMDSSFVQSNLEQYNAKLDAIGQQLKDLPKMTPDEQLTPLRVRFEKLSQRQGQGSARSTTKPAPPVSVFDDSLAVNRSKEMYSDRPTTGASRLPSTITGVSSMLPSGETVYKAAGVWRSKLTLEERKRSPQEILAKLQQDVPGLQKRSNGTLASFGHRYVVTATAGSNFTLEFVDRGVELGQLSRSYLKTAEPNHQFDEGIETFTIGRDGSVQRKTDSIVRRTVTSQIEAKRLRSLGTPLQQERAREFQRAREKYQRRIKLERPRTRARRSK